MKDKIVSVAISENLLFDGAPYWGLGDQMRGVFVIYHLSKKFNLKINFLIGNEKIKNTNLFNNHQFNNIERVKYISFLNKNHCFEFFRSPQNYNESIIITNGYGIWENIDFKFKNQIINNLHYSFNFPLKSKIKKNILLHLRVRDDLVPLKQTKDYLIKFSNKNKNLNKILVSNSEYLKKFSLNYGFNLVSDIGGHFGSSNYKKINALSNDIKAIIESKKITSFSEYEWNSGLLKFIENLYSIKVNFIPKKLNTQIIKNNFIRIFFQKTKIYYFKFFEFFNTYKFLLIKHKISQVVLVTGADYSHENSLYNLLLSIERQNENFKVEYWDLGLSTDFIEKLKKRFPYYEYRKFYFQKFPEYFNIKIRAGEYAWKPIIIKNCLDRFTNVIWLDAGDLVLNNLSLIKKILYKKGYYFTRSAGRISDWTHPKTLNHYKIEDSRKFLFNLNAAIIGFSKTNIAISDLVEEWAMSAMNKNIIAPNGSSRFNHRQDQSLLSILGYLKIKKLKTYRLTGILTHQDLE